MKCNNYPIICLPITNGNGYGCCMPDFPDKFSHGDSIHEALELMLDIFNDSMHDAINNPSPSSFNDALMYAKKEVDAGYVDMTKEIKILFV